MNVQDIKEEIFTSNRFIKRSIILACIIAALIVIGAVMFVLLINSVDVTVFAVVMGVLSSAAFVLVICAVCFFFIGLAGKSQYDAYINKYGIEDLMREIQNETLYIFSIKNRPVTIITDKHIFEVDRGIMFSRGIDYSYGYRYRGATSIVAYAITDKRLSFCNGIDLNSQEHRDVFATLRKLNPDILLGFTGENYNEHIKRVKEAKAMAKNNSAK